MDAAWGHLRARPSKLPVHRLEAVDGVWEAVCRTLAKAVPSRVLPIAERTAQDEQEDSEDRKRTFLSSLCRMTVCLHGNNGFHGVAANELYSNSQRHRQGNEGEVRRSLTRE